MRTLVELLRRHRRHEIALAHERRIVNRSRGFWGNA